MNPNPQIHIYEELDSTNTTAKKMAANGAEHGTVVIANTQTAGRGRYGKSFYSPHGGLYISFIFRADRLPQNAPEQITVTAAIAVQSAIKAVCGIETQIKPINDLLLKGKKVCGILTEAVNDLESGSINWIVLGIGVNVSTVDFPSELEGIAASLCPDGSISKHQLAAGIIDEIYRRFI